MTALELSLKKGKLSAEIGQGVVARIYGPSASDQSTATQLESFREVVIPASPFSSRKVEVSSGAYQVQAVLPNGRILQQTAVVEEGQTVPVNFNAGGSPQE